MDAFNLNFYNFMDFKSLDVFNLDFNLKSLQKFRSIQLKPYKNLQKLRYIKLIFKYLLNFLCIQKLVTFKKFNISMNYVYFITIIFKNSITTL